jgi:phosphatidylcholine synthase
LPLLASAYGFCQVSAKTADGYFLGFPSYWNIVAFYLYVLQPLSGWLALAVVVVLSLLTFIPSRYLYPTQRGKLNRMTNVLAAVWVTLIVWILWNLPAEQRSPQAPEDASTRRLTLLSLYFPAWYVAASWIISVRFWRGKRRRKRQPMRAVLS